MTPRLNRERRRTWPVTAVLAAATARHLLVLHGIARSRRFLGHPAPNSPTAPTGDEATLYVIIPVLREAAILDGTIDHFAHLAGGAGTLPIVVTTAREQAERPGHRGEDTIRRAREAAAAGRCEHLHYPDPAGLKADQLNYAAQHLLAVTPPSEHDHTFLLCYDADSRPAPGSLTHFTQAIAEHPQVNVFHQSSRFVLPGQTNKDHNWRTAIAEAGALRANRFVLAYELPRLLNRSPQAPPHRRRLGSYVYSHVTGHGLCVRLSLLQRLPFPARSPLEDMHYSFILGSRNEPVVPIRSLDTAEVPADVRTQVEQAARWFAGPARFARYLRDPQTTPGARARLQAASAAAITTEWLSCAVAPPTLAALLWRSPPATRRTAAAFATVYAAQLLAADLALEPDARPVDRLRRILAYPANCELFGIGGLLGAARLLHGAAPTGKTERGPS